MTIKQQLRRIYRVQIAIKAKEEKIRELREIAESIRGTSYDTPRVATSPGGGTGFESVAVKVADLTTQMEKDYGELMEMLSGGIALIRSVENVTNRTILEMRYINGMTFEEIADRMHYSVQTIYRRHQEGIKQIKRKMRVNES